MFPLVCTLAQIIRDLLPGTRGELLDGPEKNLQLETRWWPPLLSGRRDYPSFSIQYRKEEATLKTLIWVRGNQCSSLCLTDEEHGSGDSKREGAEGEHVGALKQ